jgi:7,8-dihydropterin-6-yl-methyl-4-(beta-D-ribofuranosyl)aminobenzene 5'-phosphate synthase
LVNAVEHGFKVTRASRLQGWIGGTHLGPASRDQQDRTIERLAEWKPDFVATNHCTGFPVMSRLQQVFGSRFIAAFVGETIEVE